MELKVKTEDIEHDLFGFRETLTVDVFEEGFLCLLKAQFTLGKLLELLFPASRLGSDSVQRHDGECQPCLGLVACHLQLT